MPTLENRNQHSDRVVISEHGHDIAPNIARLFGFDSLVAMLNATGARLLVPVSLVDTFKAQGWKVEGDEDASVPD